MLIIIRGIPGAGKSRLCREAFDSSTVVSSDSIRNELIGTHNVEPQAFAKVFGEMRRRVEYRMSLGRLTVVDATHTSLKSVREAANIAIRHGEEFFVIDLCTDFQLCLDRVLRRAVGADVGAVLSPERHEEMRDRYFASMASVEEWAGERYFRGNYKECLDKARAIIRSRNVYPCLTNNVFIFGDIHGCLSQLKVALDHIPAEALIFGVGDMIDRGEDSMGTLMHLMRDPRFVGFAKGNHEMAFLRELEQGGVSNSKARQRTHKEFRKLQKRTAQGIVDFIRSGRAYWLLVGPNDKRVLVTHAGLGQFDPEMASTFQTTGDRANSVHEPMPHLMDIDEQVHGHMSWEYSGYLDGPVKNIDGGCGKGGSLVAYNPFDRDKTFEVTLGGAVIPI